MANTFSCPTCGAPLTYEGGNAGTITCPYCRSSVIVPAELHNTQPQAPATPGLDDLLPQIRRLLAANKKIEAIKLVRMRTSWGLAQAKDFVDKIDAEQRRY